MKKKMHCGAITLVYQRARELRNNPTYAEELLWNYLRTKPLGYKFRRQHPYSIYILDFYCHKAQLVIEIDGSIHKLEQVQTNDKVRQELIEKDGLTVLRFTNSQVISELEKVTAEIEMNIINKEKNFNAPL